MLLVASRPILFINSLDAIGTQPNAVMKVDRIIQRFFSLCKDVTKGEWKGEIGY